MVSRNTPAGLQWEMQNIRGNLSEHADEAVKKCGREFDWRHYVAKHPWTAVGAAVAAGYFLVPRRVYCKVSNAPRTVASPRTVANEECCSSGRRPSPLVGMATGVLTAFTTTLAHEGVALASSFLRELFGPRDRSAGRNPDDRSG